MALSIWAKGKDFAPPNRHPKVLPAAWLGGFPKMETIEK